MKKTVGTNFALFQPTRLGSGKFGRAYFIRFISDQDGNLVDAEWKEYADIPWSYIGIASWSEWPHEAIEKLGKILLAKYGTEEDVEFFVDEHTVTKIEPWKKNENN